MTTNFEPKKFIDRESELKIFENLLGFKSSTRILAIKDTGGNGKSQLLEKLRHRCRTGKPRIPVSLVALEQLKDQSASFVVKMIVNDLQTGFNLSFDTYTLYESIRVGGVPIFTSDIDLQNAKFEGAKDTIIAGNVFQKADRVSIIANTLTLTSDQQEVAQTKVITSFFEDLHSNSVDKTIVLIFDSYDKCKPELQSWIVDTFLASCFFKEDLVVANLLLVIAGRDVPHCDLQWPSDKCEALIRGVDELSKWTRAHVKQCMDAHGFAYSEQDIDNFYTYVKQGVRPLNLIEAMKALLKKK